MEILNGAIDSLISSSNREDWTPVALNVADATVTISKEKVRSCNPGDKDFLCCVYTAVQSFGVTDSL